MLVPLALFLHVHLFRTVDGELHEPDGRIHIGAEKGSEVALSDEIIGSLGAYRGCHARVTGGDRPLYTLVQWNMAKWSLFTIATIPRNSVAGDVQTVSVGFFCADGTLRTYDLRIELSHRNLYPPVFGQDEHTVYVPVDWVIGTRVLQLVANDSDTVVYNRHLTYTLQTNFENRYRLSDDGVLQLAHEMTGVSVFGKQHLVVRACDHGSPLFCATTTVIVVPVTVSAPTHVRVNVATVEYQIFEWRAPAFGTVRKYRVYVRAFVGPHMLNTDNPLYYAEVDYTRSAMPVRHMARTRLNAEQRYLLIVGALDDNGETPAAPVVLHVQPMATNCSGQCHGGGGVPACYIRDGDTERVTNITSDGIALIGTDTPLDQYTDTRNGPQCICYQGYVGSLCSHIAECPPSLRTFDIGTLSWPATRVNATATTGCVYGPAGNAVRRRCRWNTLTTVPEWMHVDKDDLTRCRTKEQLKTHLAVLQVVFFRGDLPNLAAMGELLNEMQNVLPVAIEDPEIAKCMLKVLSNVLRAEWGRIPMATYEMRAQYRDVLVQYAREATAQLQSTDIINTLDDLGVTSIRAMPNQRFHVSPDAFVEFRAEHVYPLDFAVVYTRNSTFYPAKSYSATNNAVIELLPYTIVPIGDGEHVAAALPLIQPAVSYAARHKYHRPMHELDAPIRYGLRPPVGQHTLHTAKRDVHDRREAAVNYTCVYYDDYDHEWRTQGVYYISTELQSGMVVCEAYHLSPFSVLYNYHDRNTDDWGRRSTVCAPVLIGCVIAASTLALAVLANMILRSIWHHNRASIFACTSLTKLLLYTVYALANGGVHEWSDVMCSLFASVIQWAVLATLLWLCIEAANLFKLLRQACTIDHPRAPCALVRKAIVAWGLPTMLLALQIMPYADMSTLHLSGTGKHLSPLATVHQRCAAPATLAFYLLPALLLLIINSALFVCVWLRYNNVNKTLPAYVLFVRRESAINFMLCILFCVSWSYELLVPHLSLPLFAAPDTDTSRRRLHQAFMCVFAVLIISQECLILLARCCCASACCPIGANGDRKRAMNVGDTHAEQQQLNGCANTTSSQHSSDSPNANQHRPQSMDDANLILMASSPDSHDNVTVVGRGYSTIHTSCSAHMATRMHREDMLTERLLTSSNEQTVISQSLNYNKYQPVLPPPPQQRATLLV